MAALVYLREHTTLAKIAAGLGVNESTAHTHAVIDLLAERAPGLLKVLRETAPDFALLDGTLAERDRVGDGRADYSHKHRRRSVNVQVVTADLAYQGGGPPSSNADPCRTSPTPRRPSTGPWPKHGRRSNAVSHD